MNQPGSLVEEAMDGFCRANSDILRLNPDPLYLYRRHPPTSGKVALISGGGAGHEPLHGGFVGLGMLDAAVPGRIFTSPTSRQIVAATRAVARPEGVLYIVKNYTGDLLNFELAADEAKADGIPVEIVVVDDDLATAVGSEELPGRRGTAAVVVVEKLCGAAAERGASLVQLRDLGRRVAAASRSLAASLTGCTVPGDTRPSFELPENMYEFGVGIHGERGTARRPLTSATELVRSLVVPLVEAIELTNNAESIAIVNNLGGMTQLEMQLAYKELNVHLEAAGAYVSRALVGTYVTALDMRGISLTLTSASSEFLELWDAPVRTGAIRW